MMKGTLLNFDIQQNRGVISGDDGKRYYFIGAEWMEKVSPTPGQRVDFKVGENFDEAQEVFLEVIATPLYTPSTSSNLSDSYMKVLTDEEQYTMFDWFAKCIKNYVNFEGRARRKEFWYFILLCYIVNVLLVIVDSGIGFPIFSNIWTLFTLLPTIAVSVRRLHDINMSGWWYLLVFTLIGIIPLIIWWATDTKREENRWGLPARVVG